MSTDETIKNLFLEALDKTTPAERVAFLDEACAGNDALRQGVESLLQSHERPSPLLDQPVAKLLASETDRLPLDFLEPSSKPGVLGRLGHYEVLEVIGQGGMGVVLRAFDEKLHRIVAIKALLPALACNGSARQRFVREARAAAAITHENVISIYAVEDDGPVPYLVMQFISGCTLQDSINRQGPISSKDVLRIGLQIAEGLAAAHRQGLIHRDVKPANILLENGVQRVKLTDFGLARAADDASLTQSGLIAGTPMYMAPEQAAGEPIDARSDLFSLGSVLHEMCTGRPAFRAPTTVAVIRRVCDEHPRPIREVNPDIAESICRLIERLHSKKPADRPRSAKELADNLAGLLSELQGQGSVHGAVKDEGERMKRGNHPSSFILHPSKARPWRWAVAATVLLVVGLSVGELTGMTDLRGSVFRPNTPQQFVSASQEAVPLSDAERWEKSVAGLQPERQVKAFVLRMRERNPAFDGNVTPTIQDNVVIGLKFLADEVDDISPVRAFQGLQSLDCGGSAPDKGSLSDLTPLRGMSLKRLRCPSTKVADLEPLRGMPMTILNCGHTQVSDLSPLEGMKLEVLMAQETRIKSLTPLKGMPLNWLDLAYARGVSDLGPIRGMPLTYLNVSGSAVNDLGPLSSLVNLRFLILDEMPVSNLTALERLTVTELSLRNIGTTDLNPIKAMPLKKLRLDYRADDEKLLRSFTGLENINDKPAAEFWKEATGR